MRKISEIIVHCAATPEGRDVGVEEIKRWHVENNGWSDIGYHYVVELDGVIAGGRPEERPGAHCKGRNASSIGVCYVGGVDAEGHAKDTRTVEQKEALEMLLRILKRNHPDAVVYGHRDFSDKECPSFDAKAEYASLEGG